MNLNDLKTGRLTGIKSATTDGGVLNKFKLPVKENSGTAALKSEDNVITRTVKKINDTGLNPFGAGVNTAKKASSEEAATGVIAKKFMAIKPRLDNDNDGFVSKREMTNRLSDKDIKDQEAALVGALIRNQGKISRLSNDETGIEHKGISTHDIIALEKLPNDNKLRIDTDNAYYYNLSKINYSQDIKDKEGNLKLPLKATDINYKDLMQGSTGDCYFMSALASLAQRNPQKIIDMIKDNKNGTYTVNFAQKAVTIKAPTDTELGLYAEGKAWVPVMEKAYSELRNESTPFAALNPYDKIRAGSRLVGRAIKELTGNSYDTDLLIATPKSATREKLKSAVQNNKLMVASISKSLFGKNELKLPDGHVYTVLDYNAKTDKVTLRNPWGETEAQDKNGNPRDGKDDGIFELSLDEFDKNFTEVAYEK